MIRVTRHSEDGWPAVKLEGDLDHGVVELVRHECHRSAAEAAPRPLRLDLGDLRTADQAGLRLLRELEARPDIDFVNCASIWLTLIRGLME